ncbi:MAG: hypothetical protein J2P17_21680, partial [Mycobacterium sp.]|nr:hypothetical protein [Mycobacterium sp.]
MAPADGADTSETPVVRVEVPVGPDADLGLVEQAAAAGWFVRDGMRLSFWTPSSLEEVKRTGREAEFLAVDAARRHSALEARDFVDGVFSNDGWPRALRSGRLVMEFDGAQGNPEFRVAARDDDGGLIFDRDPEPAELREAAADDRASAVGAEAEQDPVVEQFGPEDTWYDVNDRVGAVVGDGQGTTPRSRVVARVIERLQARAGSVELTAHSGNGYTRCQLQAGSADAVLFEFTPDDTTSVTVPVADRGDAVAWVGGVLTGLPWPGGSPTSTEAMADTVVTAFVGAVATDVGEDASQTQSRLTVHSARDGEVFRAVLSGGRSGLVVDGRFGPRERAVPRTGSVRVELPVGAGEPLDGLVPVTRAAIDTMGLGRQGEFGQLLSRLDAVLSEVLEDNEREPVVGARRVVLTFYWLQGRPTVGVEVLDAATGTPAVVRLVGPDSSVRQPDTPAGSGTGAVGGAAPAARDPQVLRAELAGLAAEQAKKAEYIAKFVETHGIPVTGFDNELIPLSTVEEFLGKLDRELSDLKELKQRGLATDIGVQEIVADIWGRENTAATHRRSGRIYLNMWGATRRGLERRHRDDTEDPEQHRVPAERSLERSAKHELEHYADVEDVTSSLRGVHEWFMAHDDEWLAERDIVREPFEQWAQNINNIRDALGWVHRFLVERGIVHESLEQWLNGLSRYARHGWDEGKFGETWPEVAVQIDLASPSDPAHAAYAVAAARYGLPYEKLARWAEYDRARRVRQGLAELRRQHTRLVGVGATPSDFDEWLQTQWGGRDAVIALLEGSA